MSRLAHIHGLPRPRGRGGPPSPAANMGIREYFDNGPNRPHLAEWQTKPELPTVEEVMGTDQSDEDLNLAVNKISGPWSSTKRYLATHYNLLREDAVAPLRDAIAAFRQHPSMADNRDLVVYERVFFTRLIMAHRGMAFRACFSTRRAGRRILWRYSSRLLAGKVVALSPANNMFSSKCVVAVVAARPLEGVTKNPPEIDLFFAHPEDMDFDPLKEWIMVEPRYGYYEAHRHSMAALQKLSRERFPLSNHICGLEKQIDVPEYILSNPVMDFRAFAPADSRREWPINVVKSLPSAPLGHLNIYQQEAMKHMLTKKLAIIQGPPGTGKTFVSVTVLRLLLAQMRQGDPPIIVATHTNHALDQLLTQIAEFEPNYIRLGGRSRSPKVGARTLFAIRDARGLPTVQNGLLPRARQQHTALVADIIENTLKEFCRQDSGNFGGAFFRHGVLTEEQLRNLEEGSNQWVTSGMQRPSDPFIAWLGDHVLKFEDLCSEKHFSDRIDDCDQDYELLMEIEAEQAPDNDEWECLKGRSVDFRATFPVCVRRAKHVPTEVMERYLKLHDLWGIPRSDRGAVYTELHNKLISIVRKQLREKLKLYMSSSKTLQIGKLEGDYEILKTAKLIGMTTTGLSKYRGLVSALKPRLVMIEEAAEVLEAPVAVACFPSLQHLILVGDHKQLKGQCAVHDLAAAPYYLDVSMFERLILNNFPFVMLKEQRRMAPEIRRLLNPIYDKLHDHESVLKHEPVPGMGNRRLWFFDHKWPEYNDSLTSKVNEVEAIMVALFYSYLCSSGVPSHRITVLTFYNGQRKKILKTLMDNEGTRRLTLKVVTIDSYQGEENDIIILSLVRSREKPSDGIGFLAVDNRVCVALSRARRGLYIFGNEEHLAGASELWRQVIDIMRKGVDGEPRIGPGIPVTCRHGTTTIVRSIKDWGANSDCQEICGAILDCEHECPEKCHRTPHSEVKCTSSCLHVQPCCGIRCSGHQCTAKHVHSCRCDLIPTPGESLPQTGLLAPLAPFPSHSSAEGPEGSPLIAFSDEDTPTEPALTEKKARTKEVKNSAVNDPAPIPGSASPKLLSPFTSSEKLSDKNQRQREARKEWIKFAQAYGGAPASANDRARGVTPEKENAPSTSQVQLLDAFEEGMEASKVVALKPEVKMNSKSHETVPVKHLLD